MSFFMVDDQLHVNLKAQALIDMGQVGVAALGLWTLCGSQVQAQTGADGKVSSSAWRLLGDKRLFTKLSKLLVEVGLWEDRDDGEDGWQYHDWFDIGYTPGEKVKLNRKRAKELKNPDIVNAVRARDGDNCRYCGRKVDWKDRHQDKGATYDHVIPGLPKGVTNLVVACRGCNRKKAQRTPEQAGMPLLPPPYGPDSDTANLGKPLDQTKDGTEIDQTISGPAGTESGYPPKGQVRDRSRDRSKAGSDEGHGQVTGEDAGEVAGPAGEAPPIELSPGHTGSPWHNWHGPPPDVEDLTCPDHGLTMPCRKCTRDHYAEEADR